MQTLSGEGGAAVLDLIVVDEHDIALLHRHMLDVPHGERVDVVEICLWYLGAISIVPGMKGMPMGALATQREACRQGPNKRGVSSRGGASFIGGASHVGPVEP